ncbi:hypothetical protein ES703_61170 [subsurface metagenome]
MEASLLRFALSEHFLNVDELLRQLQTGSAAVKKKEPRSVKSQASSESQSEKDTEAQRHRGTEARDNEQQTTRDEGRGASIQHPASGIEHQESRNEQKGGEPASGQPETDIRHPPKAKTPNRRTSGQKRNEIINDPAVKTVLMGLDATITGVEENQ